jgi:hypothetical protein
MSADLSPIRPGGRVTWTRGEPQVLQGRLVRRPLVPSWDPALETWTDTRYQLLARLKTAVKRGEVREAGSWAPVPGAPGWFSVEVRRLKAPVPAWKRALPWVGVSLVALAGVVVAVGYLLSMLFAGLAAIPVWAWLLAAVVLLGGGGGTVVTVVTKVTVR